MCYKTMHACSHKIHAAYEYYYVACFCFYSNIAHLVSLSGRRCSIDLFFVSYQGIQRATWTTTFSAIFLLIRIYVSVFYTKGKFIYLFIYLFTLHFKTFFIFDFWRRLLSSKRHMWTFFSMPVVIALMKRLECERMADFPHSL